MDKPQHSDPLQEKRRQTDVNLSTEREKTDEALKGISESIETSFDETIAEARARDDCATKRERKIADREIAHQRSETPSTSVGTETRKDVATKGSENINENVDENISERVKLERQRSDAAIERERSRVHVALERERDAKTAAMNTMLEAERGQTDESLDAERVRTDQDMSRSHSLLMHEALEHGKTKTLLMTRDEFLAIVSHDLRNPLSAIASSVEMLLEEATKKGWDSEGRRWLELIHRNANAAIRLIQDLIDVERMAEGKLEFRFSRHLVRDILLEAVESFRSVAQANGVRLQADHELLSGYVVCDRGRITQVLSNLLGNAIKFTPRGG
ncbi:MAG: HAMP domain-containing histidine kinase, partial [Bdellovibrionaceae bacterium]|nr:HAMP domain-containing histidine kinase [Pseudobdellovibrionaceae bacterium]